MKPKPRLCFKCKSDQHLLVNCPLRVARAAGTAGERPSRVNARIAVEGQRVCTAETRTADECGARLADLVCTARPVDDAVASVQSSVTTTDAQLSESMRQLDAVNPVRIMPLKSIKVITDDKPIDALVDSGAQIVLLNKSIFPGNVHSVGEIRVRGILVMPLQPL